jgi:uncharacterized OB-fold protein
MCALCWADTAPWDLSGSGTVRSWTTLAPTTPTTSSTRSALLLMVDLDDGMAVVGRLESGATEVGDPIGHRVRPSPERGTGRYTFVWCPLASAPTIG